MNPIISIQEVSKLPKKTLIYFTNRIPPVWLPNSYYYIIQSDLSDFVNDVRRFEIQVFPVICYDDGDMDYSSRAYWILKAIGYDVFVLYGGINACQQEGFSLLNSMPYEIAFSSTLMVIDYDLLPNLSFDECIYIKELPFLLYEVLGKDIKKDKVKKLLKSHGLSYEYSKAIFSGNGAAVFGIILSYLERKKITVFLGEWNEPIGRRKLSISRPESFYTVNESIYYDAEQELPEENKESKENKENGENGENEVIEKSEKSERLEIIEQNEENEEISKPKSESIINHYKIPFMLAVKNNCNYHLESRSGIQCKGCILF